jgi:hypothetical protein
VVPPASHKVSRASWYSGCQSERAPRLPTGLSPSVVGRSSPLGWGCVLLRLVLQPQPVLERTGWFGLFPVRSPLLRESRLISLRRATEMFQFAHGPPTCLWIRQAVSRHHSGGVAPFGYSGLLARMQLPLNVSPVSASFIGLQRRGIHLVLCLTCSCSVLSCLSLPPCPAMLHSNWWQSMTGCAVGIAIVLSSVFSSSPIFLFLSAKLK